MIKIGSKSIILGSLFSKSISNWEVSGYRRWQERAPWCPSHLPTWSRQTLKHQFYHCPLCLCHYHRICLCRRLSIWSANTGTYWFYHCVPGLCLYQCLVFAILGWLILIDWHLNCQTWKNFPLTGHLLHPLLFAELKEDILKRLSDSFSIRNLFAEAVWDWMRGDLVTVWGIAPWFLVRHRLTCFSIKMSEYSPPPPSSRSRVSQGGEGQGGVFLVFMRMSCHLSRGSAPGRSPSTHGWRRRSLRSGSRSDSCDLGGRSPSVDKSSNRYTWDAPVSKVRLYEYFPFWIPLKNKQGFGWEAQKKY